MIASGRINKKKLKSKLKLKRMANSCLTNRKKLKFMMKESVKLLTRN